MFGRLRVSTCSALLGSATGNTQILRPGHWPEPSEFQRCAPISRCTLGIRATAATPVAPGPPRPHPRPLRSSGARSMRPQGRSRATPEFSVGAAERPPARSCTWRTPQWRCARARRESMGSMEEPGRTRGPRWEGSLGRFEFDGQQLKSRVSDLGDPLRNSTLSRASIFRPISGLWSPKSTEHGKRIVKIGPSGTMLTRPTARFEVFVQYVLWIRQRVSARRKACDVGDLVEAGCVRDVLLTRKLWDSCSQCLPLFVDCGPNLSSRGQHFDDVPANFRQLLGNFGARRDRGGGGGNRAGYVASNFPTTFG